MMKLFKRSVTLPPATVTTVARRIVDRFKPRAQRSRDDTNCLAHSPLPQPACWCAENQLENRLSLAPHRPTPRFYLYARCMRRAALAVLSLPACVFEYQNSLLCSLSASRLHVTCFPDVTMCPLLQGAASCVSCRHGCVTGALHAVCPCSVSCPLTFLPPNLPLHVLHGCPPGSTSVLALGPPHEWPIEWPEVADGCRRLRSRCQSSSSAASGRAAAPHHSNPRSRHRWHT